MVSTLNRWADAAVAAEASVNSEDIHAAWRALNYLSAAQLYLSDNVLLTRPIAPSDVKDRPSGHWGTCPPVNLLLANLGPIFAHAREGTDALVVHGAGHAGPAAFAHAYLTGRLGAAYPRFRHSSAGLRSLVAGFPHADDLGSEITPLIPGQHYMGGQLGPALAFAHGAALDAPDRLVVALIGDGECEIGATAAAWLAAHALKDTGSHGRVLPVVLLNGMRMGGPSLLSTLGAHAFADHLRGLGYRPVVADAPTTIRASLTAALTDCAPLQHGPSSVLICTLPKGDTGPVRVGDVQISGRPRVHKTPLRDPRRDDAERRALQDWLMAYRPAELFDSAGRPVDAVRRVLAAPPLPKPPTLESPRGCANVCAAIGATAGGSDFSGAVTGVLRRRAASGGFRLFSPDELASNRIALPDQRGRTPTWTVEVLNEEICHAWAQGYTETGRQAVVATYEAFAPIASSLIAQQLKYRRLARRAARPPMPSIVYLITSLSWNNSYTHQNPSLVSTLLAQEDPTVHVLTPADAPRAAASLTFALRKPDRCTLVVAGKHPVPEHPRDTLPDELWHGLAIWPHLSDTGPPDLVLAAAGDVPVREMAAAVPLVRTAMPHARLRFVAIHDLTALGSPQTWPLGLSSQRFAAAFGISTPVLIAVPFFRDTVRSLLWGRPNPNRFAVVGYVDTGRPTSPVQLLHLSGMHNADLAQCALSLLPTPQQDLRGGEPSCTADPIAV